MFCPLLKLQHAGGTEARRPGRGGGAGPDRGTESAPRGGWNRLIRADNGYGGQVAFSYGRVWEDNPNPDTQTNYHRVLDLRRSDTSNQSYSRSSLTQYSYGAPALNDALHAATVVYAIDPPRPHEEGREVLARPEHSEFRGRQTVTERVYDGADTSAPLIHEQQSWFYQGDATVCNGELPKQDTTGYKTDDPCFVAMERHESWKGRVCRIEVRVPGGGDAPPWACDAAEPTTRDRTTLLQRTQHRFERVPLPQYGDDPNDPNVPYPNTSYLRAGLWRAFNYETETVETAIERDTGAPTSKQTTYLYDTQYDNLTAVEEIDQTGMLVRKTQHSDTGLDTDSAYMVDRLWSTVVRDGQDRLLALSHHFYSGSGLTNPSGLAAPGDLLREAHYFDVPLQTSSEGVLLHGTDTTYGYDAYGNRTTDATYPQAGTRLAKTGGGWEFSAPGNGSAARTATMVYDPTLRLSHRGDQSAGSRRDGRL
jgi:hypothetical protein